MTKNELIDKCNKLANEIDDLDRYIIDIKETASNIRNLIEDMPFEESDIENSKIEED